MLSLKNLAILERESLTLANKVKAYLSYAKFTFQIINKNKKIEML